MSDLSMELQQQNNGVVAQSMASREMEEVKGQIFMAKQFPRDVFAAENRIKDACKRPALAHSAIYSYPRGGTKVTGPSIRLAEVVAQNWGNMSFGIKELEQKNGESTAMAYAWDLETNVRQEKIFTVKHQRKANGKIQTVTDPRDIYELVANNGARRLRACVMGIIPGDIFEMAVSECDKTLEGQNDSPLKERFANAFKRFKDDYRVTKAQIEERLGYNSEAFSERDYLDLIEIFNSLKDGMSKPSDWFNVSKKEGQTKSDLAKEVEQSTKSKSNDEVKADGTEQPKLL
ncbi:hypothetical protein ACRW9N_02445 [Listeria aquatica]|uniref:hypothetical protein n=1 Tax=Listeria aquatica TaxID=1494960 RepID=UPI003EF7B9AF